MAVSSWLSKGWTVSGSRSSIVSAPGLDPKIATPPAPPKTTSRGIAAPNACAISLAVANRSSGFLANAFKMTSTTLFGSFGFSLRGGGGGLLMCCIWMACIDPWNGMRPVAISYSTTPSE